MGRLTRRARRYLGAAGTAPSRPAAEGKGQLERAMAEAGEAHRRLVDQAAGVIANQRKAEARLARAREELDRQATLERRAVAMADEAARRGDSAKAAQYTTAAESFAHRRAATEDEVEESKHLLVQATEAAHQAKAAVAQYSSTSGAELAERHRVLGPLDRAALQERLDSAMASLGEPVGPDVPSPEEVRARLGLEVAPGAGGQRPTGG